MAQQRSRTQGLNGLPSLAYVGVMPSTPINFFIKQSAPTTNDYRNCYVGDMWLDNSSMYAVPSVAPTVSNLWILVSVANKTAVWVNFSASIGTVTGFLTQDGNTVTPTAGIVQIVGANGLVTTGTVGPNTITITAQGTIAQSFPTDSGTATPAAGVLIIRAGTATVATNCGSTVEFEATGNIVKLDVSDVSGNTIVGRNSGNLTLTATNSTVFGAGSAQALTSSPSNVIVGHASATSLAGGAGQNTIVGKSAAQSLVSGTQNLIYGYLAGSSLTGSESNNTIIGSTGVAGSSGLIQLAIGANASTNKIFLHNYPGSAAVNGSNIFLGEGAGNFTIASTSTVGNIGIGGGALQNLTSGVGGNIGIGDIAFNFLTTGVQNTGVGKDCFASSGLGTGLVSGSYNTALGFSAGAAYTGAESSNILIGASVGGTTGESNTLHIGQGTGVFDGYLNKSFIHGIRGITTVNNNAIAVLIDSAGQLGTVSSSREKKDNIVDMGSYSDRIRNLRPVVFNYKEHSPEMKSVGLIAEEVDEVMPELVACDGKGGIHSVKYQDLVPMLLNEFQKHCAIIAVLQSVNTDLLNRIRLLEENNLIRGV